MALSLNQIKSKRAQKASPSKKLIIANDKKVLQSSVNELPGKPWESIQAHKGYQMDEDCFFESRQNYKRNNHRDGLEGFLCAVLGA